MKNIIIFFDFVDRVIIKCFLEGVVIGILSLLAMLAAIMDGMFSKVIKVIQKRFFTKPK